MTDDKKVFYCGSGPSYQNLFCAMINELQMCKDSYQEMLEMYLRQIFIKLQRYFNNSIRIDNSRTAETIDMAIAYFNEHYSESISIEEYAEKNHVDTRRGLYAISNFMLALHQCNLFCKKRICNAEALLLNTEYNINEIAQIVGYDNALYFSRMFKKIKGISPSEYRKNI